MDDMILAARLFEKGDMTQKAYIPQLRGQDRLGNAMEYGKNLLTGAAGALMKPVKDALDPYAEQGQKQRYPGVEGTGSPLPKTPSQAANLAALDQSRLAAPPTPAATAPENQPAGGPQQDTDGDGQLTANDTKERTMNTEVKQTLAPDGSVDTTQTTQTTTDKNADGLDDTTGRPVNSPDPNTNATPTPAAPAAKPAAPTKPTATQNAAGRQQVANAQKLTQTGSGGMLANIAGFGLPAMYGAYQRRKGNKQLANLAAGAGGQTNANMIRADGTEFLDDYWNLQKARMEARERGTTEAVRNAYR
jgi:hypothetical protein